MRVRKTKVCFLLHLVAVMLFMPVVTVSAADAISLPASEPYTMYYTTNGATPSAPIGNTSATPATPVQEVISLVPNAGKGNDYKKPEKLKIHESRYEFEKHVKEKHGKRFRVETFNAKQTEYGLEGYIHIVENRDPSILQLADACSEEEWARRVAIAKEFIVNNPEMIWLTENEELRVLINNNRNCLNVYFDSYVNGYQTNSNYHMAFRPQFNYSISADLSPITPEMYAAAHEKALTEEEIAAIVYKDMNIKVPDKNDKPGKGAQSLPKLRLNKYLTKRAPYVIWEVRGKYFYVINAITGEILNKDSRY